jgi:superfamily II DNA or RNA helicase
MSTMLKPRPYQVEALTAVKEAWTRQIPRQRKPSELGHPAVVLPTGMGKTVIFAHLVAEIVASGGTPLVLVHRDELADQAYRKIRQVAPHLTVGIVKAGTNHTDRQAIVGSVQTLARERRRDQLPAVTHIIVDECHHAAARSYLDILGHFPNAQVVGFTATMVRGDRKGLGDVWSEVVYSKDLLYGIRNGYLTDVIGKTVVVPDLDMSRIKTSHGDFQDSALAMALEESEAGKFIAQAYLEHCPGESGILFAPNVETAHMFSDDLNAAGITAEVVTGETPKEARLAIYARCESGQTKILSNCMVATEGFDMPRMKVAIIARPTSSVGLYVQMVGRVLRPYPGKGVALVLDVVGVASKLALASVIDLSPTKAKPRDGETLSDAAERLGAEEKDKPIGRSTADLSLTDIDLFHRAPTVWLQSDHGVWFIPTMDVYYVLWPLGPGDAWTVNAMGVRNGGRKRLMGDLSLESAMAWAQQFVEEAESKGLVTSVGSKSASWRKKGGPPSQAQLQHAHGLGIDTTGMSKTQVADAITVRKMSDMLPMPYPNFAPPVPEFDPTKCRCNTVKNPPCSYCEG